MILLSALTPRLLLSGLQLREQHAVVAAVSSVTGLDLDAHTVCDFDHRVAALDGLQHDRDLIDEIVAVLDGELEEAFLDGSLEESAAPILVATTPPDTSAAQTLSEKLLAAREHHADFWELQRPVERTATTWKASSARNAMHAELDGAHIDGRWDCSTVSVWDGVVDEELRCALLNLLGESEGWEPEVGPDAAAWERGFRDVLLDVESETAATSWGLGPEALERLCTQSPTPAPLLELQSRLQALADASNPDAACSLCRMPAAALGDEITPLAANAPTAAEDPDTFQWHIDADPNLLPPSPWTDYYGRYPNREPGRPRFVTALLYLSPEWQSEWGAPTRFLDLPTSEVLEVDARPGRLVLMDQDITHAVTAPTALAGSRPRYSLVLKLVLHPPEGSTITPRLAPGKATRFGSAGDQ